MHKAQFVILSFFLILLLLVCTISCHPFQNNTFDGLQHLKFKTLRPPVHARKFRSAVIDQVIANITSKMKDKQLAFIFENSFPNTLDTTVEQWSANDTFIVTGDIKAMWLRDSTNQIWPYLPFVTQDSNLKSLVKGLLLRQSRSVLYDPYANAYLRDSDGLMGAMTDSTYRKGFLGSTMPAMTLKLQERKWEVDSLCAVLKLSAGYFANSNDTDFFNSNSEWLDAIQLILDTLQEQQHGTVEEFESFGFSYWFSRQTSLKTETLLDNGRYCSPSRRTGMVKTAFRPSDDSCTFSFNVAQNGMCVVYLKQVAQLLKKNVIGSVEIAERATQLANEIDEAIRKFGVVSVKYPVEAQVFAYEVDGFNSFLIMDDGNVPSLLSLPYLGYVSRSDPTYAATRKLILSENNPYFFKGTEFQGIGSPHTGWANIWPMSIIMQALTSESDEEVMMCLKMLRESSTNGFIHESFNKNNPGSFSRSWFAWANTLFGELILTLAKEKPHLIF